LGEFSSKRTFKRRLKDIIETPGGLAPVVGLIVGLGVAVLYGLLIGGTELQTVVFLSAGFVFVFMLVAAGDYWWALLVILAALGISTGQFGFNLTGFEIGFVAVIVAYLIRSALRAMREVRPAVGLGVPFWALFLYLVVHTALVVTYHRYQGTPGLKNIVRGYYSALAPLAFFYLLAHFCHPRTVKPVVAFFVGAITFTTSVALPVFLFEAAPGFLREAPFSFAWLDSEGSGATLRGGPILATFAVALWPFAHGLVRKAALAALLGLSLLAATASSGRLAFAGVLLAVLLFLVLNRKWMALGGAGAVLGLVMLVVTTSPGVLDPLPKSMQRAVAPLNVAERSNAENNLSDKWHHELRTDSFKYWTESFATFYFGHGYGAWDESLNGDAQWNRDFEYAKKMAVQMGKTENAFSAITNIFGLIGLLLYLWFLWNVGKQLFKARKLAPVGSFARAMCEVSLVYLEMFLLLSLLQGGVPGWEVFYFQLGLLAARPLLAAKEEEKEKDLEGSRKREAPRWQGSAVRAPARLAGQGVGEGPWTPRTEPRGRLR
jgi:hypothetical protein